MVVKQATAKLKVTTQDEVAALVTKINNDKNNAIAEINKQTTAQGVTTEKIMVSQCWNKM